MSSSNECSETADTITIGGEHYGKQPYVAPKVGALYLVRDKLQGERIIRIMDISPGNAQIEVATIDDNELSPQTTQLPVESLVRQAAKGWCCLLTPLGASPVRTAAPPDSSGMESTAMPMLRLDIQNFSRCCADIARAKIRFDTQLIKDVADGPFRAGNYEQSFLTFEQIALAFTSAVAASRRAIADGRRMLVAEKGKLSGREIQERTAAFTRSEQLIHTAEREFSTILEGLRMHLRAKQDT